MYPPTKSCLLCQRYNNLKAIHNELIGENEQRSSLCYFRLEYLTYFAIKFLLSPLAVRWKLYAAQSAIYNNLP